ncbi:MAG: hypothetical protein WCG20_01000 [bacterium]
MGKNSKGGNKGRRDSKGPHTIRNTTRKIRATPKSGAVTLVMFQSPEPINLLDTLKEKFPLAIEAIIGKFINFQAMKFEEVISRIQVFFKTMNITCEFPKGVKDVVVIHELITGPLERAETDLANLSW